MNLSKLVNRWPPAKYLKPHIQKDGIAVIYKKPCDLVEALGVLSEAANKSDMKFSGMQNCPPGDPAKESIPGRGFLILYT
jgi:hypothetical protein